MKQPDFSSLRQILVNSRIQVDNNALFQVLNELINRTMQSQSAFNGIISDLESTISALAEVVEEKGDSDETYLTADDESVKLVNSRKLLAGLGIFFNDSVVNERTVDAKVFPVGSIIATYVPTNPSVLLGYGTWDLFATGIGSSGFPLELTVQ